MSKRILIACPECYTQFGFESPQTTAQAEQIVALETENTRLKQQLKDTRDELSAYRLASERAIYDAQQLDPSLYLNTDRGVEDVMRRVLGELKKAQAERALWERRANALLEIAKAATDIVSAAYAIQDSGNYVVLGAEYERLQNAVETCKRMSEEEG